MDSNSLHYVDWVDNNDVDNNEGGIREVRKYILIITDDFLSLNYWFFPSYIFSPSYSF